MQRRLNKVDRKLILILKRKSSVYITVQQMVLFYFLFLISTTVLALRTFCQIFFLPYFCLFAGDNSNQVHMEGYQVSNQCMALVRDNCLIPTKDAPELGYVRESTDKQYVPDVYYKVRPFSCFIFKIDKLKEL